MAQLVPFRALRPAPEAAAHVASVPYDVVNTEEARALAAGEPHSFLHVTRSEIDLPPETSPYDDLRLRAGRPEFRSAEAVGAAGSGRRTRRCTSIACAWARHEQTGVAGCFSVDEYEQGAIKKHEKTRKDKEDDRTRHILELRAQTGVVFLAHRASRGGRRDRLARDVRSAALRPCTPPDDVRHQSLAGHGRRQRRARRGVQRHCRRCTLPTAITARRALLARRAELRQRGGRTTDADQFIAVSFPDTQVQILSYNRTVKDLAGETPESLIRRDPRERDRGVARPRRPSRAGLVSMFLGGKWYSIELPAGAGRRPAERDAGRGSAAAPHPGAVPEGRRSAHGQAHRLRRRHPRHGRARAAGPQPSGGGRVLAVSRGDGATLMAIADAGGIMPPKIDVV